MSAFRLIMIHISFLILLIVRAHVLRAWLATLYRVLVTRHNLQTEAVFRFSYLFPFLLLSVNFKKFKKKR